jgi:hypothetical protein
MRCSFNCGVCSNCDRTIRCEMSMCARIERDDQKNILFNMFLKENNIPSIRSINILRHCQTLSTEGQTLANAVVNLHRISHRFATSQFADLTYELECHFKRVLGSMEENEKRVFYGDLKAMGHTF